jgi:hypothetical protein
LSHQLSSYFYARNTGNGKLLEFEFFDVSVPDLASSYREFQRYLEQTFGPPELTGLGKLQIAFLDCPRAEIVVHFVQERVGPEEHVRIPKISVAESHRPIDDKSR